MKLTIELTSVEYEYLVLCLREKQRDYFSKPGFDFFQKLIDKVEEAKEESYKRDYISIQELAFEQLDKFFKTFNDFESFKERYFKKEDK